MLAAAAGAAMLAPTAILAAASLRIRGWSPFVLATLTLAAAEIVALTLLVSAFGAYERGAMLFGGFAFLVAVLGWWLRLGRPRPPVSPLPSRPAMLAAARENRTVAVLLAAALVAVLIELVLALAVVPNTWDSMMYHLSRVALWIQDGSVFGVDGGTIYETQHQPNGEFLYGWTVLLADGDRLAALVQWLAGIGCGIAVYWGALMAGWRRPQALFAGALLMILPGIVTQASSTLVDMPGAFLTAVAFLFLVRAIAERSTGDLVVSSLALGVALGVKGTTWLAVPGLILIGGAALAHWRPPARAVAGGALILAAGALLLGAPKYVENLIDVGSPQGQAGDDTTRTSSLRSNAEKALYGFVDIPGLAGTLPAEIATRGHDLVWAQDEDPFGETYVSEDGIGYGPIGFLLFLPLLAWFAFSRGSPPARRLIAIAAGAFVVAHIVVVQSEPYVMHTMVTGVVIGAPLLAWAAERPWTRHLTAAVAIAFLLPVLVQNQKKPLYPDSALGLDRAEQQSLQHAFAPALERIDDELATDARIGFVGMKYASWDYPYFGPGLDRYVYRVEAVPEDPPTRAEITELIRDHMLDAVVFSGIEPPPGMSVKSIGEIAFSEQLIHYPG